RPGRLRRPAVRNGNLVGDRDQDVDLVALAVELDLRPRWIGLRRLLQGDERRADLLVDRGRLATQASAQVAAAGQDRRLQAERRGIVAVLHLDADPVLPGRLIQRAVELAPSGADAV